MHLNQWRQYKGHIKDGCFHISLLTIKANQQSATKQVSIHWHILHHLSHLNHRRQYKVHIKYGCFHIALLAIPSHSKERHP